MEFTGKNYEDALRAALAHFKLPQEQLQVTVIEEGVNSLLRRRPWKLEVAPIGQSEPPAEAEAVATPAEEEGFSADEVLGWLEEEGEGEEEACSPTISVASSEEGLMLRMESWATEAMLREYCRVRKIAQADIAGAFKAVQSGEHIVKLAPPQELGPPVDDSLYLEVSTSGMEAYGRMVIGDHEGQRMTIERARQELEDRHKIVFGIDDAALRKLIENPASDTEVIAKGAEAVDGVDGELKFHFRLEHNKRPRLLEGDTVDYRSLDLFENVTKGQELVSKIPGGPGVDGSTVRGKVLKARIGRDVVLPKGKGVQVAPDGNALLAAIDGMVEYVGGKVQVLNRYVIEGDVDMSVGNIDFVGDVLVMGNIISGMVVKAQGSVEVHGVVEAATVIAGRNVLLHQGMQGLGDGTVKAGGDVIARYFERSKVRAGGTITADAIYYSEISSMKAVILAGKRGGLVGGMVRSATMVAATTIGTPSYTATVVEVGILPEQRERLHEIESETKRMERDRDKLSLMVRSFQKEPTGDETPERVELRERVMATNEELNDALEAMAIEKADIQERMSHATEGHVHVIGSIYPGVRVIIGAEIYEVGDPIEYATFRHSDGRVTFGPCQYS